MMELAASYTAAKDGNGVPCLLPVFLALKPEHAKKFESQMEWLRMWEEWELSESGQVTTSRVQSKVWMEALGKLLDTRGPIYKPHEHKNKTVVFSKEVARLIAEKLDELSKTMVLDQVEGRIQQFKMEKEKEVHVQPCIEAIGLEFGTKMTRRSESLPASDVLQNGGAHEQEYAKLRRETEQIQEQLRSECSLYKAQIQELEEENAKSSSRIKELQMQLHLNARAMIQRSVRKYLQRKMLLSERKVLLSVRKMLLSVRKIVLLRSLDTGASPGRLESINPLAPLENRIKDVIEGDMVQCSFEYFRGVSY